MKYISNKTITFTIYGGECYSPPVTHLHTQTLPLLHSPPPSLSLPIMYLCLYTIVHLCKNAILTHIHPGNTANPSSKISIRFPSISMEGTDWQKIAIIILQHENFVREHIFIQYVLVHFSTRSNDQIAGIRF